MCKSDVLAKAAGIHPASIKINAMALISGMFYTSRFDNLKHYTLNYAKALAKQKAGHEFVYYKEDNRKLSHAFLVFEPHMKESQDALDRIAHYLLQY